MSHLLTLLVFFFVFPLFFLLSDLKLVHFSTDGTLYICLPPSFPVPSSLSLSYPCSNYFSHPHAQYPCELSFRFHSLLQITYSLLLPGDSLSFFPNISTSSSSSLSLVVPAVPPSWKPFVVGVSGPIHIIPSSGLFE